MKINWKVRIANKQFWTALIPAVLLLGQVTAGAFGFKLNLDETGDNLLSIVNALFGVLVILGIVNDPTVQGISDSARALEYREPKPNVNDPEE